jgi:hypothetical protein
LPYLRAVITPVKRGDVVIFFTDGIRRDFLSEPIPAGSPRAHRGPHLRQIQEKHR